MTTPTRPPITPDSVRAALQKARGNVTHAATILGCSRETVYTHLRADPTLATARDAAVPTPDVPAVHPVTVRLTGAQVDALDALRGDAARSAYLRDLIADSLASAATWARP